MSRAASQNQEGEHGAMDPQTWTTPANALVFVHNIESALSALDPAHVQSYTAKAQQYAAQLTARDKWATQQLDS